MLARDICITNNPKASRIIILHLAVTMLLLQSRPVSATFCQLPRPVVRGWAGGGGGGGGERGRDEVDFMLTV